MIHNKYKKKIINNLIISKFNIKNIFELPEIKKVKAGTTHKNNKLFFILVASAILLTANYPKKKITKKVKGFKNPQLQLFLTFTKKKYIYNFLTMLIFLVYSEIPNFRGFNSNDISEKTGIFNYNFLPFFFEVSNKVLKEQLPLKSININFKISIEFKNSNKNINIFLLKALQFPIAII